MADSPYHPPRPGLMTSTPATAAGHRPGSGCRGVEPARRDRHRVHQDRWVDLIEPTTLDIAAEPGHVRAWLVALTRT